MISATSLSLSEPSNSLQEEKQKAKEHQSGSFESSIQRPSLSSATTSNFNAVSTQFSSPTSSPLSDRLTQASPRGKLDTSPKDKKRSILRSTGAAVLTIGTEPTSPPSSLSIEERLKQAALNAKLNRRSINLNKAKSSGNSELRNSFKIRIPAVDNATAPNNSKPFKAKPDPDLSSDVQHLLHYQRGRYSQPSSEASKESKSSYHDEPPFESIPGVASKYANMINSKAICSLLTENMDENASDWV